MMQMTPSLLMTFACPRSFGNWCVISVLLERTRLVSSAVRPISSVPRREGSPTR
jgi:hypothetical protein